MGSRRGWSLMRTLQPDPLQPPHTQNAFERAGQVDVRCLPPSTLSHTLEPQILGQGNPPTLWFLFGFGGQGWPS